MEYFLTFIFVVLLAWIFYLVNKIQSDREKYKSRLIDLEKFIFDLNVLQENQSQQLQLSQELRVRLKKITSDLNNDILDLNNYLFQENYQKRE